jgi:regulator of sigma E protease
MKVLKFSLGFGPKLLTKQGKETEYSLRAVPLG